MPRSAPFAGWPALPAAALLALLSLAAAPAWAQGLDDRVDPAPAGGGERLDDEVAPAPEDEPPEEEPPPDFDAESSEPEDEDGWEEPVDSGEGGGQTVWGAGADVSLVLGFYDGEVEYERFGSVGNQISLEDDLPFDGFQPGVEVRLWGRVHERLTLELSYFAVQTRQRGTARDGLLWDDIQIQVGDRVRVVWDFELLHFGGRIGILTGPALRLEIPVGVQWSSQRLRVEHRDPQAGQDQRGSARVQFWAPYVGVRIEWRQNADGAGLGLMGQALLMGYPADTVDYGYFDVRAQVSWGLGDTIRLFAGPRFAVQNGKRSSDDRNRVSDYELISFDIGLSVGF